MDNVTLKKWSNFKYETKREQKVWEQKQTKERQ